MSDRRSTRRIDTTSTSEPSAREARPSLLEDLLESQPSSVPFASAQTTGVFVGVIAEVRADGVPLVNLPNDRGQHCALAKTVARVSTSDVGREVVVMFENGDPSRPIIVGVIQPPTDRRTVNVQIDGERFVVTAEKEIVLRCGEASITLTRAGKVLVRGTYVLSRSAGVNKIQGGSIQLN